MLIVRKKYTCFSACHIRFAQPKHVVRLHDISRDIHPAARFYNKTAHFKLHAALHLSLPPRSSRGTREMLLKRNRSYVDSVEGGVR